MVAAYIWKTIWKNKFRKITKAVNILVQPSIIFQPYNNSIWEIHAAYTAGKLNWNRKRSNFPGFHAKGHTYTKYLQYENAINNWNDTTALLKTKTIEENHITETAEHKIITDVFKRWNNLPFQLQSK